MNTEPPFPSEPSLEARAASHSERLAPQDASSATAAAPQAAAQQALMHLPWGWMIALALAVVALLGLSMAWKAQQRVAALEHTLVGRQEASQRDAAQAQALAKQANDKVLEAAAKVALLEARVAEVAVQRGQFEEVIQSLSRSRDENLLVDIEAGIRVALQQSAITGSAEPLVAVLKQSDDRLVRYNQPRLEGVRRAIARDLDRVKAVTVTDVASLSIKLDEVVRLVDDLPLLAIPETRRGSPSLAVPSPLSAAPKTAPAAAPGNDANASWWAASVWQERWNRAVADIAGEARSLVRVTRIGHPDAMLLAPEQAFFLRENLKLRLLNARLALLSRQFETAQSDLQLVLLSFDRYFDRQSRRTSGAVEAVRQVAAQSRQVQVPRPDNTLAALSAVGTSR